MTICVKFFASLKEQTGISNTLIGVKGIETLEDVWQKVVGQPQPEHVLCALNHQYVDWHTPVSEGDEVAFFPPVSGG